MFRRCTLVLMIHTSEKICYYVVWTKRLLSLFELHKLLALTHTSHWVGCQLMSVVKYPSFVCEACLLPAHGLQVKSVRMTSWQYFSESEKLQMVIHWTSKLGFSMEPASVSALCRLFALRKHCTCQPGSWRLPISSRCSGCVSSLGCHRCNSEPRFRATQAT